jgi:hypothetical protein
MRYERRILPDCPPLHGLRLKLEGKPNEKSGCCANFTVVYAGKGPHKAELRCANCGSHRGWLPKEAASWLLTVLTHFPEARADVHVIRSVPSLLSLRGAERGQITRARERDYDSNHQ